MFRAELDGLPIEELSDAPHRSMVPGKAHLCGHDGHMATLAALARGLGRERPAARARGPPVPARRGDRCRRRCGAGGPQISVDRAPTTPSRCTIMPGLPLGHVALDRGPVNCASRGMRIALSGKTAHAATPEEGVSPMAALATLMPALTALGPGGPLTEAFALVTVTHARMGEPAFGIAPAHAEIWATLRTVTDAGMDRLRARAESLAREAAQAAGLGISIEYQDVFVHCENDPEAVEHLRRALDAEGVPHDRGNLPMRPSEDFGRFGTHARSAMFFPRRRRRASGPAQSRLRLSR